MPLLRNPPLANQAPYKLVRAAYRFLSGLIIDWVSSLRGKESCALSRVTASAAAAFAMLPAASSGCPSAA